MQPEEGAAYHHQLYSRLEVFKDDDAGTGAIVNETSLVRAIASLGGSYQPTADQFYIHYSCSSDEYTVQIRYAFATTYGQSFDSLTPLPVNGERSRVSGDSWNNAFLETINWGANPLVYFAFRVKENPEWGHREICIPTDPQAFPPLPGGVIP